MDGHLLESLKEEVGAEKCEGLFNKANFNYSKVHELQTAILEISVAWSILEERLKKRSLDWDCKPLTI